MSLDDTVTSSEPEKNLPQRKPFRFNPLELLPLIGAGVSYLRDRQGKPNLRVNENFWSCTPFYANMVSISLVLYDSVPIVALVAYLTE